MDNTSVKTTSGNLFYYTNTGTTLGLLSTNITMRDPVDRDILQKAVDTAMQRYPYLAVRPCVRDGAYHLDPNPLPFVVTDDGEFAPLGEAATNYHLLTFTCKGNELSINFDHALMDGRGSIDPMYSVLYYYCKFKYNRELDCPGVKTVDTPFGENEYASPYDTVVPPVSEKPLNDHKPWYGLPEETIVADGVYTTYAISVNQKAFMKIAKSSDSSPMSLAALLLMKAIEEVHPEHEEELVCLMPVDYRDAVGCPETHQNAFLLAPLFYPQKMRDMSLDVQGTCMRGQIVLRTEKNRIKEQFLADAAFCGQTLSTETLEEKRAAYNEASPIGHGYPICSYVGQCHFGDVEQYITAMHFLNGGFGAILLEITSVGEDFGFDFSFGIDGREYVEAYLRQFDAVGIPYRADREFKFHLPLKTY